MWLIQLLFQQHISFTNLILISTKTVFFLSVFWISVVNSKTGNALSLPRIVETGGDQCQRDPGISDGPFLFYSRGIRYTLRSCRPIQCANEIHRGLLFAGRL